MLLTLLLACTPEPLYFDTPFGETDEPSHDSGTDSPVDTSPPVDTGDLYTGTPRVILFIGDGMGLEHVAGGGLLLNGEAGTLSFEGLPNVGRLRTASMTGTTDSAASGTALGTGYKTWNGRLGIDRHGNSRENLRELALRLDMATGVVTTDKLVGATPASFLVHQLTRYDSDAIADELITVFPDVLLGGGEQWLGPRVEEMDDIQLVRDKDELAAAVDDERPLVGLFAPVELTYQVEIEEGRGDHEPSLSEMTMTAISRLEQDPDGFFLMVEGARIDHASHANREEAVHFETVAFAAAVQAAMDWAEVQDEEVTILVTADHECGGLHLTGEEPEEGEGFPGTEFFWGKHTNDDVGVYAMGPHTGVFAGERLDARWVHAALSAALEQRVIVEPTLDPLTDGWTEDVGEVLVSQTHDSDVTDVQLDALRVSADRDGLRIGVDGVFTTGDNLPVVLVDVDFGGSTGLGGDNQLGDFEGSLDVALSSLNLDPQLDGLGFDLAIGAPSGSNVDNGELIDPAGMRGLAEPWYGENDLWWLSAVTAFDDGNLSRWGDPPEDAAPTGTTEGGLEVLVPWYRVYEAGLPVTGMELAVVVVLTDRSGTQASNQALPPLGSSTPPGTDAIPITQVVRIDVDLDGNQESEAWLYP